MSELNDLQYYLGLALVDGLGPRTFRKIRKSFGSLKELWSAPRRQLLESGLSERSTESLLGLRASVDLPAELDRTRSFGVDLLPVGDLGYPQRLKEIDDPPLLLFVKGSIRPVDSNALAVVGTRRLSSYGKAVTTTLVRELSASGLTIVSGLALGIDSVAHKVALDAGGRTLAVLGHGLDQLYPPQNRGLAEEITRHGALISEFPLGFPPVPGNFPARNRVISGLSLGVLVCEAPEKSGAMVTAACALEQGRQVFAVPGSIYNPGSFGTGSLIQSGAKLVLNSLDVLSDLGFAPHSAGAPRSEFLPRTEAEQSIIEILSEDLGGLGVDDLVRRSKLPVSVVSSTLIGLEMVGAVEETNARWLLIR